MCSISTIGSQEQSIFLFHKVAAGALLLRAAPLDLDESGSPSVAALQHAPLDWWPYTPCREPNDLPHFLHSMRRL